MISELQRQEPDAPQAIERYRAHAEGYDASAARTMPLRRRTIAALELRQGDAVLDVACGTGLSFALLVAAVGAGGQVTGVELSPDMARLARRRIACAGWSNVALIEAAAEDAALAGPFDAVLFNFTHDVLQSPSGLANLFAAVAPGARVAASGSKLLPRWLEPANALVRRMNAPYLTTFAGLRQPWRYLAEYVPDLKIRAALWGAGYVAHGHYAPVRSQG
jgi:demethylmenaquinone methyltransferase/2-methoxy-6-polyprenyl-1,4-benzoquinol methylase